MLSRATRRVVEILQLCRLSFLTIRKSANARARSHARSATLVAPHGMLAMPKRDECRVAGPLSNGRTDLLRFVICDPNSHHFKSSAAAVKICWVRYNHLLLFLFITAICSSQNNLTPLPKRPKVF